MAYHTTIYLFVFLPIVMVIYQITKKSRRLLVLLASSYFFYFSFSQFLLFYLLFSTVIIYFGGLGLSRINRKYLTSLPSHEDKKQLKQTTRRKKKCVLMGIILFHVIGIIIYKYRLFLSDNINTIFTQLTINSSISYVRMMIPLGISFFSLQAISYIVDIYFGKIEAEKRLSKVALYLAFFPTVMEGPITKYDEISDQITAGENISYKNLTNGAKRIIWGMFKKIVIADRAYIFVAMIFGNLATYTGVFIIVGTLLYTLQLYAEFSGSIDIVIGTAEIFGIKLPENFKRPFFSRSVAEFWRRWHISLGRWLKDYIFYPVSLSKTVKKISKFFKGKISKILVRMIASLVALFFVWLANGLWHGPRWSYIFYGMYYFALISAALLFEPVIVKLLKKIGVRRDAPYWKAFQWLRTFILVNIGMLIFRADGLKASYTLFINIFTNFDLSVLWNGQILQIGLDIYDFWVLGIGMVILIFVSKLQEDGMKIREKINSWWWLYRVLFYYGAILAIIIFGAYGSGYRIVELIYAGF
ncbi:MAG: MBOAT family O-acyltransferase [Culicoidibacterales bacterium]